MSQDGFAGDKKDGVSLLHPVEVKFKEALLPCVPQGIETYHLTLLTVVWSILVVLFSWLATYNRQWMWGASLMVVAQYISDLLDGAIGRQRNTGLVKWGFYMDHFLDYIFLCSILIGYSLLMPNSMKYWMFFIFAIIGAFMVNSFLQFAATNKFRIAYWGIGPTEGRLGFIAINTLIIYVDKADYVKTLPYILAVTTFALFFMVYNTQRQLWKIDMDTKAIAEGHNTTSSFDGQGLIIRYFLVSFVLASLAFLVLVAQLGGPLSKQLAGFIYVLSWLPLALAFIRYRQAGHKQHPHLQRFGPIVAAALIMICCAWAGVNLMPAVEDSSMYLTLEYRAVLAADAQQVLVLQTKLETLLGHPLLRSEVVLSDAQEKGMVRRLCAEFMEHQEKLSAMRKRTQGYYLINYLDEPGLHTDSFLVGFAAQALQMQSVLALAQQTQDAQLRQWLNHSVPETKIPDLRFDDLMRDAVSPKTLFKLGAASSYVKLLSEMIEKQEQGQSRLALRDLATEKADLYVKQLQSHSLILKEIRLQLTDAF